VDSLGSVELKKDGLRPEAGSGAHDEDMIILGLACHLLETLTLRSPPRTTRQKLEQNGVLPRRGMVDDGAFQSF
jgi:hypothetical protein